MLPAVFLFMTFSFCGSLPYCLLSQTNMTSSIPDFTQELSSQHVMDIIENLSSHATRKTGTSGCNSSAYYIQSWLQNNTSSTVSLQYFSYESEVSMNVLASVGDIGPRIIICAHYDSISYSEVAPGANDDASGIAAALEAFRLLSNHSSELNYQIIFAAFAGEEQALLGSRIFVQKLLLEQQPIMAVINIDTVGYGFFQSLYSNLASLWLADILMEGAFSFQLPCVKSIIGYPENSAGDHQSFWNVNIPAVLIYEHGPQYPFFHGEQDTIDKVNFDLVKQAALISSIGIYLLNSRGSISISPILMFFVMLPTITLAGVFFFISTKKL